MISLSPGCSVCPRAVVAKGKTICSKCEAELVPTPLRAWRAMSDTKLSQLVVDTGLSKRSVLRADAGERMSREAAEKLARATGLHWRTFRPRIEEE